MKEKLNYLGKSKTPFFFVISFDLNHFYIQKIDKLKNIYFKVDDFSNFSQFSTTKNITLKRYPVDFEIYQNSFNKVIKEIEKGNTYLLNLTFPTKIELNCSLFDVFKFSKAKFKLFFLNKFVCFSPERFIKIENNNIYTYPMKGTIDANIINAKQIILNDTKEMAEHIMIVDLLRNDLSIVAKKVRVEKFRYIDKIKAGDKELLQVSSKIKGELKKNWQNSLGEIITSLLPVGSISGTPKIKTTQIIKDVEIYERGYFSGIFGYFDGENFDSAVMIRFIEKTKDGFIYKSGGGITIDSDAKKEYQEMVDKVYLPI